jgi:hypothetical protein
MSKIEGRPLILTFSPEGEKGYVAGKFNNQHPTTNIQQPTFNNEGKWLARTLAPPRYQETKDGDRIKRRERRKKPHAKDAEGATKMIEMAGMNLSRRAVFVVSIF